MKRIVWLLSGMAGAFASVRANEPHLTAETYNQWKEALPGGKVTAAGEIRVEEGFLVELVRMARPDEGSWVAMAFDPAGGILIAREDRGLLRVDPREGEGAVASIVNDTLEEVRGLLFAHGSVYANANNSHALFRLRDSDGDGRYETVQELRRTPGGVGHGRNQLALGPDGLIYLVHGDDVRAPAGGFTAGSAFAHAAEDRWLPLDWDRFNWSHAVTPPAGHVVRTDPDGQRWEIVCGGLRNPFGIAFNPEGDMFTYDADIEWDVGLPWYRPTRVLHLASGADFGWRGGFRAMPSWLPDTAPAAVDIGKGSPTAIAFGTRSHFPDRWRRALFIMDWAYGVIYAVDLQPSGASYRGTVSVFLQGRPLNATGLDFGPDGALYFVTGGRRTRSALYRVKWIGSAEATAAATDAPAQAFSSDSEAAHALRRKLETLHGRDDPRAIEDAWPHLAHDDPWIRQAARLAIEAQPPARWIDRALTESRPIAAFTALLAAARTGGADTQPSVRDRLLALTPEIDREEECLLWARALQISVLRHGPLNDADRAAWIARLDALFPNPSPRVNRLLCESLCAFDAPAVIGKSFALLESSPPPSQEDALHVLLSLRVVRTGWTMESRRTYLAWLARARRSFVGAAALPTTLNHLRAAIEASLTDKERLALAPDLIALDAATVPAPISHTLTARAFQKSWTSADFPTSAAAPPDPARGRRLFTEATCAACHRAGAIEPASATGPDLSGVGQRFDHHALIESLVDPWKIVAPQYRLVSVTVKSGAIHEGPIVAEDEDSFTVSINPVDPGSLARIKRAEIVQLHERSTMPPGLLNTFTHQEILDLAAWLQAGAP